MTSVVTILLLISLYILGYFVGNIAGRTYRARKHKAQKTSKKEEIDGRF